MGIERQSEVITDASPILMRFAQNDLRSLLESSVYEGRGIPQGDGHHVVLVPGLSESDKDLIFLRNLYAFLFNSSSFRNCSDIGLSVGNF